MINGKRNGFGILKSRKELVKLKAYWIDDKPVSRVILDSFGRFLAFTEFKDGQPNGEFAYYSPLSFIKLIGKASIIGK